MTYIALTVVFGVLCVALELGIRVTTAISRDVDRAQAIARAENIVFPKDPVDGQLFFHNNRVWVLIDRVWFLD